MEKDSPIILSFLLSHPALIWGGIAILSIIVFCFIVAVFQGREVSFWPPKIGTKVKSSENEFVKIATETFIKNESNGASKVLNVSTRSIAGIWLCQYYYPRLDESTKQKIRTLETQLVCFEQSANQVKGSTIYALAHPEAFEGKITQDRYFTGLYFNKHNHHSYHGALQLVISNSQKRMKGRWVGFNREGNDVDSDEWRWVQVDDNQRITEEKKEEFITQARSIDLFSINQFL
jgi:hypothetical protein